MATGASIGQVNVTKVGAFATVNISKIAAINSVSVAAVPDSISLDWTALTFDYLGNACDSTVIVVTSSGSWTLGTTGVYFTASPTSGSNGASVSISCNGTNNSGANYLRTITFTCGTATAQCSLTQSYNGGTGCA